MLASLPPLPHSLTPSLPPHALDSFEQSLVHSSRSTLANLGAKCATFIKSHSYTVQQECRRRRRGGAGLGEIRKESLRNLCKFSINFNWKNHCSSCSDFRSPFLSVYVGLGVVKRIKTNVRHLREENEVERNRQRGEGERADSWPGLFSMASEDA